MSNRFGVPLKHDPSICSGIVIHFDDASTGTVSLPLTSGKSNPISRRTEFRCKWRDGELRPVVKGAVHFRIRHHGLTKRSVEQYPAIRSISGLRPNPIFIQSVKHDGVRHES